MTNADDALLDRLYAPPSETIQKMVLPQLVPFHIDYLRVARFFCLATGRDDGMDASPRGGAPGFVQVVDAHHLAFADWPGNNRIESMRNLAHDAHLGMLFLFPGLDIFLRINGRGRISTEPALLARLAEGDKLPKTAIVVEIDQVLFHCGKAVNRAALWDGTQHLGRDAVPSVGAMRAAMTGGDASQAQAVDADYARAVRQDLY